MCCLFAKFPPILSKQAGALEVRMEMSHFPWAPHCPCRNKAGSVTVHWPPAHPSSPRCGCGSVSYRVRPAWHNVTVSSGPSHKPSETWGWDKGGDHKQQGHGEIDMRPSASLICPCWGNTAGRICHLGMQVLLPMQQTLSVLVPVFIWQNKVNSECK